MHVRHRHMGTALPPVQQIRGSGLVRVSAKGVHVTGCSEHVLIEEDGLANWGLTAMSAEGLGHIFLSEGCWWLEVTHPSDC